MQETPAFEMGLPVSLPDFAIEAPRSPAPSRTAQHPEPPPLVWHTPLWAKPPFKIPIA